jgi:uridine phosphorylase
MTSAGKINNLKSGARFVLIEKAIRDEGTSGHYLESAVFSCIDKSILDRMKSSLPTVETGISWTTDAPFRETKTAIEFAGRKGAVAVEMEASALYAFAEARNKKVICFAHLTNNLGQAEGDFEKGLENGSIDSLEVIFRTVKIMLTIE